MRAFVLLVALVTSLAGVARPAEPSSIPLDRLKAGHPRLSLDAARVAQVRQLIATNPVAAGVYANQRKRAESMLKDRVSAYEKPDGKRLLSVSGAVLDRVTTLAFVRWMENDRRFADRAWKELEAAAAFPDWNPAHFLDTAVMTRAFALGYDWLYADWTPEQRARLEKAILELGLTPGLEAYAKKAWWVTCDHNWNQVCHSGLGLGALAVADRYPNQATAVLEQAAKNLPIAVHAYAPDGAGLEGPGYWSFGCGYNVAFLDGLRTALGSDLGLDEPPELAQSGAYHIYFSGAGDRPSFNFSDCGSDRVSDAAHFWLGRRYDRPAYAWLRYQALAARPREGNVADLLWFDPRGADFDTTALPLDRCFRHAECASMRSSWTDPHALVLGIKGGDNTFNHWHLDLGSFILEAQGERWFIDSGVEHQTYQAHKHHLPRWAFYRVRAEGHNTLVLNPGASTNGPDQDPKGRAAFTSFDSRPGGARAALDLTSAYDQHATSVVRSFEMAEGRGAVLISDAVRAGHPADLWWFAHTEAEVKLLEDGRYALLSRRGKQFGVRLESPAEARFGVMDAHPLPASPNPEIQDTNAGRRKLFIHLEGVTNLDLRVRFAPTRS